MAGAGWDVECRGMRFFALLRIAMALRGPRKGRKIAAGGEDGSPPPSSRGQAIHEDNEIPRLRFDALEMTSRRMWWRMGSG